MGFQAIGRSITHYQRQDRDLARRGAIDHVLCNSKALDLGVRIHVDYGLSISDHYPLVCRLVLPLYSPLVWCWPKPYKIPKEPTAEIHWDENVPMNLTAWSAKASRWIIRLRPPSLLRS